MRLTLNTMKQNRSMTAAAIIHSPIICWFLTVCWRSRASVRSFLSSRALINVNWRSNETTPRSPAAADWSWRCEVSLGTSTSCGGGSILTSGVVVASLSSSLVVFIHISDASHLHTTRFIYQHSKTRPTVAVRLCDANVLESTYHRLTVTWQWLG